MLPSHPQSTRLSDGNSFALLAGKTYRWFNLNSQMFELKMRENSHLGQKSLQIKNYVY